MRLLTLLHRLDAGAVDRRSPFFIPRFAAWSCAALVVVVMMTPLGAWAQLAGTGTIQGTVADPSGAVVPGAQLTAQNLATGAQTIRTTTKDGLYSLAPLDAGNYTITVTAPGFETLSRQNIHVDGMQVLALDLTLQVGTANVTVTVATTPPPLETENATLGAVMENDVYQSLPLEMGGANGISTDQRRTTDYAILMPGVTNNEIKNNESDEPMVVNGNAQSTVMYIEGIPLESASVAGDPRFIWPAFSVDTIDQFQLKTTAYSAEYQGLGVENFTVKSGSNKIHGSAYDIFRNTSLDSAGFIPAQYPSTYPIAALAGTYYTPPEHMNEYGFSIGGPIWKNKIFLFANYMGFRFSALTKPQAQNIPTPAELCGDFSAADTGNTQSIYDPTTQVLSGGAYKRTQFSAPPPIVTTNANGLTTCAAGTGTAVANVIPYNEISPISQYLQQWMAQPNISGVAFGGNNYIGSYLYGLNNYSTAQRLDFNLSDRHKLSIITAIGRQSLVGAAGSQTTDVLPLPYEYAKTYAPISYDGIFEDTFVINQNTVNQFKYGAAKYHSPDDNPTYGIAEYAAGPAAGISNLPSFGQAPGSFPIVKFTGGSENPAQWGGNPTTGGYVGNTDEYTLLDNLQWIHGKHALTFGGQFEWMSYNYLNSDGGTSPVSLNFVQTETAAVTGASATVTAGTGQPFASYLLGAVDSGSYSEYAPNAWESGARYHPFAFYVNDDWKLTSKLTVNAGLRWDTMPPMFEARNRISFLNPTGINPVTGTAGTLQFAGGGTDGCGCHSPMRTYFKDWGPRLGFAYALGNKTVVRGAYGIYYAHGGGTSGGNTTLPSTSMELGLSAAPNPSSPGFSLPAFYLNNSNYNATLSTSAFGTATVAAPPVFDPAYGTYYANYAAPPASSTVPTTDQISSTLSYLDPHYGGRTPTFEGWSFGIQRLITKNITATVSYVGNQGHFLLPTGTARGLWSNQLNPSYFYLGSTVLGSKTQSNMPTGVWTYPNFNNTVAQDLVAFPQFKGVTDQVGSVGNASYNSLQLILQQRFAYGLTFMVAYTYSKTIDDVGTFRTGYAIPAGAIANSSQAWPLDRIDRSLSTQDQPQNLVATSAYDLPFGKGHIGGGNPVVRNIVGGWRLSDIFSYFAGNPLAIVSGTCTNLTGQGQCMPIYNPAFTGSARQNGGWGAGATRTTLTKIQYINPLAFAQTSGEVLGNTARTAPYGLRGPGNYDIDGSIRRTFDISKDGRVKFIFAADVFNAVNHVWFGSTAATADGSINSSVSSGADTTLGEIAGQANNPRQWQFEGHIDF